MLLQQIAVLLSSIIQGCNSVEIFIFSNFGENHDFSDRYFLMAGLVHRSLLYLFRSISKLFTIHVFQLVCVSGCYLRLKSQVSAGMLAFNFNRVCVHAT